MNLCGRSLDLHNILTYLLLKTPRCNVASLHNFSLPTSKEQQKGAMHDGPPSDQHIKYCHWIAPHHTSQVAVAKTDSDCSTDGGQKSETMINNIAMLLLLPSSVASCGLTLSPHKKNLYKSKPRRYSQLLSLFKFALLAYTQWSLLDLPSCSLFSSALSCPQLWPFLSPQEKSIMIGRPFLRTATTKKEMLLAAHDGTSSLRLQLS